MTWPEQAGRRMVLPAVVWPEAASVIVSRFGVAMEQQAEAFERLGSEQGRMVARQVRAAVASMRESARQRNLAHTGGGSVSGTTEPAPSPASPESVSPPWAHLTVIQVAEKADVSESYVKRLCRDKVLSATKPGREWLIDAESFAEWQTARTARRAG